MAASKESIEKVRKLNEKRASDATARKEWDRLVKAYDHNRATKTPTDLKGKELEDLILKLAAILDKAKEGGDEDELKSDCDESNGPCEGGVRLDQVNLDDLAERVFARLIAEARVERQRAGWWA